jgi:hypothetical protein
VRRRRQGLQEWNLKLLHHMKMYEGAIMDTLKAWLRRKQLSVSGKKEQLVKRVVQAMGISFQ